MNFNFRAAVVFSACFIDVWKVPDHGLGKSLSLLAFAHTVILEFRMPKPNTLLL